MNESEKELTSEESLKLINRMMYEAKGYFYESGIGALVWGFSILLCSLLTYALDVKMISFPFAPFYLLVPVFFVQSWIQIRENKKKKARTFTDEAIDYVWTGFFLSAIAAFSANFAGITYMIITIILFSYRLCYVLNRYDCKVQLSQSLRCYLPVVCICFFFYAKPRHLFIVSINCHDGLGYSWFYFEG